MEEIFSPESQTLIYTDFSAATSEEARLKRIVVERLLSPEVVARAEQKTAIHEEVLLNLSDEEHKRYWQQLWEQFETWDFPREDEDIKLFEQAQLALEQSVYPLASGRGLWQLAIISQDHALFRVGIPPLRGIKYVSYWLDSHGLDIHQKTAIDSPARLLPLIVPLPLTDVTDKINQVIGWYEYLNHIDKPQLRSLILGKDWALPEPEN